MVSAESLNVAQVILDSSGRRVDTPVRKSFVRSEVPAVRPPLAQLYSGGRGGAVPIKLYLALLWRCSAPPFTTEAPARAWAQLLDLDDPEGRGARRINAALAKLAAARLITVSPRPGIGNEIGLLDESGDGTPYGLPSTGYIRAATAKAPAAARDRHRYFKVPSRLWLEGHIQELSGPGLVMLLILLAEEGDRGKEVWFSTGAFGERYGISHKPRTEGTRELVDRRLLRVKREKLAVRSRSTPFSAERIRNVYTLRNAARVKVDPPTAATA